MRRLLLRLLAWLDPAPQPRDEGITHEGIKVSRMPIETDWKIR